jgi:hypothetical protein
VYDERGLKALDFVLETARKYGLQVRPLLLGPPPSWHTTFAASLGLPRLVQAVAQEGKQAAATPAMQLAAKVAARCSHAAKRDD